MYRKAAKFPFFLIVPSLFPHTVLTKSLKAPTPLNPKSPIQYDEKLC